MDLGPLLVAHSFLIVERPPTLWPVEVDDEPLIRLLGEMIAAALAGDSALGEIILRANNVTINTGDGPVGDGDYVALSVLASGDWAVPTHWSPSTHIVLVNHDLDRAARAASIRYAYASSQSSQTGVTILLPRS